MKKKTKSGEPPVIWRCPNCKFTATSKYGAKTHVFSCAKIEVRKAIPGTIAGVRSDGV